MPSFEYIELPEGINDDDAIATDAASQSNDIFRTDRVKKEELECLKKNCKLFIYFVEFAFFEFHSKKNVQWNSMADDEIRTNFFCLNYWHGK